MPKLSDTMEEGTILRWLKHEGEQVTKGEVLAEVETDKADMELEANESGTLTEIRVKEGQAAGVGTVLAVLSAGAAAPNGEDAARDQSSAARTTSAKSSPAPATQGHPKPVPPAPPPRGRGETPHPVVPPPAGATPRPRPAAPPYPTPPVGRQELSKLRLTVAKQMSASKREVPHFYVTSEIDMSEAARLREALAAQVAEHITFTHLVIRALALTLPKHPRVNASWSEGAVTYHDDVNLGIAVAVEDGLIAPVLARCQRLSLRGIARAAADLISKAQAGHFSGAALTGATFTVSNMGMLDVEEFSAVITPPQAAILAVGSIKDRPVVRDGQLAVAKTMRVTLSVDHRVLTGVEAGRFLEDVKQVLENPLLLLLADEETVP